MLRVFLYIYSTQNKTDMKKLYALLALLLIGFQGLANMTIPEVPTEKSSLECATITQTSSMGTSMQTVCVGTPIMVISYSVANGGTGATAAGLPPGVTSSFAGGTFTISGTPTAAGIFPYTVSTVGGDCGPATLGGTITVNPNAMIFLASPALTANQTVCINTPITNILYTANNGATGATVTGLPSGVNGVFNSATQTMTLSGAPTVPGTFNYMVTTVGGCGMASLSGMIIVQPDVTLVRTSSAGTENQTVCLYDPIVNINYALGNGATGASVMGLPAGISGSYNAALQTMVISGMPTVSGTFNYTVMTSGGCSTAVMTGTIVVVANATVALQSGADNQTVCLGYPIVPVVYAVSSGTVGATAASLPPGCTGTYNAGTQTYTISGTATLEGTFTYTVTTIGGCGSATSAGTITVMPNADMNLTSTATGNSVTFDWSEVPGASGYLYNYSINGGAQMVGVITFPTTTEFTLNNLPPNSVVTFNVSAQGTCANGMLTTQMLSAKAFDKIQMAAYPNPVIDVLHLKSDRVFSKVQVFNTLGRLMSEIQPQSGNPAIDMSAFAPGIYFVKAMAGEAQQTFSIVKQ